MGEEAVEGEGKEDDGQGHVQQEAWLTGEEGMSEEEAEGQSTLPCEEEAALGGTSLTVVTQFDEEQEETRPYQSDAHPDEHGGEVQTWRRPFGAHHQDGDAYEEQSGDDLTLQFCIRKDEFL